MVKVGIGIAGLALIGVVLMVNRRPTPDAQAPVQESEDLPGGMERESEGSESLERESSSVGGRRKTKRKKRKSKKV